VIGVVSSTLNPKMLDSQNVNFAVRATYLRSLLGLLPEATCAAPQVSADLSASQLQERFGGAIVRVVARH
jgi:hypothetical protein